MIIINHSADYSGLGIGKAPVVNEETRELLSGFTGIDYTKGMAFQRFLEAIGGTEGAIWNGIDRLYIPMFANGILKDAFFELKNGEILYPNNTTITDANVGDYYELTTKGVKIVAAQTVYTPYAFQDLQGQGITKKSNNSLLFAISEYPSVGGKQVWNFGGSSETGTNSTAALLKLQYQGISSSLTNTSESDAILLVNRGTSSGYGYGKSGSNVVEPTVSTTVDSPIDNVIMFGSGKIFTTYKWPAGLKMFGFGDALADADAKTLAYAIEAFNRALS